ncbi:MAG TPA: metallophosphoesterase [Pirellulales bacterium]|nr:metallophosphoesterase [Pirellulales bacterium]
MAPGTCLAKKPAARPVRNWRDAPAIVDIQKEVDIVAIGDVHGDYERLIGLLKRVGIVPETPEAPDKVAWSGGETVLVCTGDLIDKGNRSLDVIACFRALRQKAADAGGAVYVTMGNHEAEFLADPEDDEKAEKFLDELDHAGIEPSDIASGNDRRGVGKFLLALPLAVRINDWFFAHACDTQGATLANLAREIEDSVNEDGFAADVLVGERGLLEARLKPIPWWERDGDSPKRSEARLRGYADALGIKHFVMGHQPGKAKFSDDSKRKAGEMVQKFDGLIFLIDVGMSSAINKSEGAALKIVSRNGTQSATRIGAHGDPTQLWSD